MNIDTSLLREKFVIHEKTVYVEDKGLEIRCPSTRMQIDLQAGELPVETFIVRTHNMHGCARMVARIILDYEKKGPILSRLKDINWKELWNASVSDYERNYNPQRWVCIYHNGKILFQDGEHHAFLDVIEKCDVLNKGDYDKSIDMAEDAFHQNGKDVTIRYDSNVALVA